MTKKIVFSLLLLGSVFNPLLGQSTSSNFDLSANDILKVLSSDAFGGRKPGSAGMQKATAFVCDCYTKMALSPLFNHSYMDTLQVGGKEAYNLVGVVPGNEQAKEYVLIGAHLDHLGTIRSATDSVYNGANDDASGVTAVLRIAASLKAHTYNKHVMIALFTGEESGMIGSAHLAKRLKAAHVPVSYVINYEMLGYPLTSDAHKIYASGFNKSDFAAVCNKLMGAEFVKFEPIDTQYGLFGMADNYPFYKELNIPSHTLCTYDFKNDANYHELGDEYSKLNLPFMNEMIEKSTLMVKALLESDASIRLK